MISSYAICQSGSTNVIVPTDEEVVASSVGEKQKRVEYLHFLNKSQFDVTAANSGPPK